MEAMASARAVVAIDSGDVSLLIEPGKTGFVVSRDDETAFIDRLATLIESPRMCAEMGRAARQKAEREFSLERLVADTFAAYQAAGWCNRTDRTRQKEPLKVHGAA
jgi:glycosyltransferase involved in cell wall biosynthesis